MEGECNLDTWRKVPSPKDKNYGSGWCRELDRAYVKDNKYVAMMRNIDTSWGTVEHVCIRNVDNTDIPWAEKQRIKNELIGDERIAIEVFPKVSELVDDANMYHLWVLPEDMKLPFSLYNGEG